MLDIISFLCLVVLAACLVLMELDRVPIPERRTVTVGAVDAEINGEGNVWDI